MTATYVDLMSDSVNLFVSVESTVSNKTVFRKRIHNILLLDQELVFACLILLLYLFKYVELSSCPHKKHAEGDSFIRKTHRI